MGHILQAEATDGAAVTGAGRTSRCCTRGGIVGASVIDTRRFPRSHFMVQWPRSQFSTASNVVGAVH